MERKGLERSVAFLQEQGVTISVLVTDRHPSIRKWVRESLTCTHLYDVWHVAKGNSPQSNVLW